MLLFCRFQRSGELSSHFLATIRVLFMNYPIIAALLLAKDLHVRIRSKSAKKSKNYDVIGPMVAQLK